MSFSGNAQLTITCPADISEVNDPAECSAIVNFIEPVGSGSGTGISTSLTAGLPPGSAFPVGTTTVTYTVTNNEGDSESCSFDITVSDTEDPVFNCPPDITVAADPITCEAVVTFSDPTATDNCNVASITQIGGLPSGSSFPIGESNIDYRADDDEGNSAFCRFKIIVEDVSDPEIICPADITVEVFNSCDTVINYTPPVGTDNCSPVSTLLLEGIGTGGTFPLGTTIEKYKVTDLFDNSDTCQFLITVLDGAPPQISCPADIVTAVDPGTCEAVVSFPDATATDNCPGGISITQTGGDPSGSSFPVGTNNIEYTATDLAGNSSTCSFTITVEESIPPEISCPADITVNTDPGTCEAIVVYTAPVGTDNCSGASTVLTSGIGSGGTFPIGTTTETYTVTDVSGNTASCSFDIIVEDGELPVIDCPVDIIASTDPGLCEAVVNFADATANDNCPGVVVSQSAGPVSGSSFPVGTTNIEFTAQDGAGNITTCAFDITVEDTEPPVITCPSDIVQAIPGGECSISINYPDPVITDNCPGSTFSVISGPSSGDEITAGDYTVELEALDASGNTATCTFNISLSENSLPVFDCPTDIVVPTDPGLCEAAITFSDPSAVDSCSAVTISQTGGPASGSIFPVGSTPIEFTAEDEFGNTSTCTFNIVVEDDENPVINCPADIVVTADPGTCETTVNFLDATANDNCPGVAVSQSSGPVSGSIFSVGTTQIEYTAEDAAGNTSICTFSVIVEDDEDPEITCPGDISLSIPGGNCSTEITYADPTLSDNCPGVNFSVLSGPESGDIVTAGNYTVELQATDAAGNTASCSFNIEISETSLPVFDCPTNLVVPADPGACEADVTFPTPTATDSCSSVTVTQTGGPASGSTFPAGNTTIEFTAEDAFGNTSVCSFDIIVQDDTDPTIDCPDNITIDSEPGLCGATVNYPAPTTDDNCGVASVIQLEGLGSGSFFPVGETTETYEVNDVSGNSTTCSFTITVVDNELPTISCPADINQVLPDGDCSAVVNYSAPTANDNCGVSSVNLIDGVASGEEFPAGTTTVTFQVEDLSGNTATCSFDVILTENIDPEITCPDDIVLDNDPGICGAVVNYDAPIGTDNCPNPITTQIEGLGPGAEFPVGVTTETYEVTDVSGNSMTCSFTITVNDTEEPLIDCPENISVSNDAGSCSALVNYPLPTATDNCDGVIAPTIIDGLVSGSDFPVGLTNVTFEAIDDAGNSTTCTFTVEVLDTEVPEIICPGDIEIDATSGDCDAVVNYADPTISDNCPGVTSQLIDGLASGSSFPVGVTTVTYEATDQAGNTAQCSFTVTVSEDVPPMIDCPEDIEVDNDQGLCGAVVSYDTPVGTDNCDGAVTLLTEGLPSGSEFPVGSTTVTYQVTDLSGNTESCSFDVTVTDADAPIFDCPDEIEINTDPGVCGAEYTFQLPPVTDNCTDEPTVSQTGGPVSGTVLTVGTTEFSFESTDEFGNTSTCSYNVVVIDDSAPTFTSCPADGTIEVPEGSCEVVVSFDEPTATDNCEVTISQSQGPQNGSTLAPGAYAYIFQAIDNAGNVSICEFTIEVIDLQAPEVICPESFESCNTNPEFEFATATDNCEVQSVVQTSGPESGGTFPLGETIIEFTATDINGNTSTCSFTITVLETAPRADAGNDQNICDSTSTVLFGNDPENAAGMWLVLEGSGILEDPNNLQTEVTGLSEGVNSFIWQLDPQNGCNIEEDTINVFVESGVIVDAGEDQLIFLGSTTIIDAFIDPPGGEIQWSPPDGLTCFDCEDPTASPDENTLYFIDYTTELGCEKRDSVFVRVFRELPNTITPDGDGVNDVWNIPELDNYPDVNVLIYNRWGNEVFSSRGYPEPWDGTQNGKELPTGSYFYIIDYGDGNKDNLSGSVNIIR